MAARTARFLSNHRSASPRSQQRSRVRRFRLITRTSRQPLVVQQARVAVHHEKEKPAAMGDVGAQDGDRTRTGDTTIFSRRPKSLRPGAKSCNSAGSRSQQATRRNPQFAFSSPGFRHRHAPRCLNTGMSGRAMSVGLTGRKVRGARADVVDPSASKRPGRRTHSTRPTSHLAGARACPVSWV